MSQLVLWAQNIKLEHTLFSAPFLLVSLLLAAYPIWPDWTVLGWCALALVGARSAAMSLNRLLDARFDALNPRTAQRTSATGELSSSTSLLLAFAGFACLGLAAFQLPPLCGQLFPLAVFWLSFYSYTKRFSWACHFVLGIALAGAVWGGWIASTGSIALLPLLLGLAVAFWVAGFDILYALQDLEFDREAKLHSIPSRFGHERAVWIARGSHVLSFVFFLGLALLDQTNPLQAGLLAGAALMGLGLIFEHVAFIRYPEQLESIFFRANALLSIGYLIVVFLFVLFSK